MCCFYPLPSLRSCAICSVVLISVDILHLSVFYCFHAWLDNTCQHLPTPKSSNEQSTYPSPRSWWPHTFLLIPLPIHCTPCWRPWSHWTILLDFLFWIVDLCCFVLFVQCLLVKTQTHFCSSGYFHTFGPYESWSLSWVFLLAISRVFSVIAPLLPIPLWLLYLTVVAYFQIFSRTRQWYRRYITMVTIPGNCPYLQDK